MRQENNEMRRDELCRSFHDFGSRKLSELTFDESWRDFQGDIKVSGLGILTVVFQSVDLLRDLDVRIYLPSEDINSYSHLKILASLGVDCGLWMKEDIKVCDEAFVDLASYNFMSPVPHALIEPFAYIASHINDEKNIRPLDLYACECKENEELEMFYNERINIYYNHFMELDQCAKCKAFRICSGCLRNVFTNCEQTLSEVLEYVVIGYRLRNDK